MKREMERGGGGGGECDVCGEDLIFGIVISPGAMFSLLYRLSDT